MADKFLGELAGLGRDLPDDLCWQVGSSPNSRLGVTVRGEVVDAGAGGPGDYPADAAGKVALVDHATTNAPRIAQVQAAVAAGVAALVWLPVDLVYPRRAQAFSPGAAVVPAGTPIPVVGVAQAQKYRLRDELAPGPLTLAVSTTAHRDLISQNVLATRRGQLGGADAPVVMVSAHYDSVIGAPGANDDGSGTGLCLELARVPRALPTEATVAFSLWGSEEQGLIGSRYHVAQLPQPERDRLTGVFQNDMVATSWDPATRYWLLSFTGENNVSLERLQVSLELIGTATYATAGPPS